MQSTSIADCVSIDLPKVLNPAGSITAVNNLNDIPFSVRRVYYLYDVPGGASRGGHAHKALQQLLVAASGSFDVALEDGKSRAVFRLSRPDNGLLVPPGLWRELENFSSGAICLVLASTYYAEEDYIRDFAAFKVYKGLSS